MNINNDKIPSESCEIKNTFIPTFGMRLQNITYITKAYSVDSRWPFSMRNHSLSTTAVCFMTILQW